MKEFYLTEIVNSKRSHSHKNKTKTKKSNFSLKTKRIRSNSLGMHAYLSRNSKFFNDTKLQFLDFLIEEQTKFADLEKIETYYRSLTVKTHKEYNDKKLLIEKKKEELKALDISIESHLINSIKFKKEEIENFFEKIKTELSSQISDKSYNIECFKNVKERLYESHIILQKTLQDQLDSETICDNQVHKYKIIKNDSIYTMQRQKKFLNNMKIFHDLRNMTFQSEIGKRKSKFNKIEYTLLNIRNDAEEIQQSLRDFKEKISDRQNSIAIAEKKNQSISNDYKVLMREFLKIHIRMLYLKKNLQVKSVEEIILRFNQERLNYQNYYSRIVEMNKSIASLNIKHTQIKNKLELMNSKISIKNNEKNFSQSAFACCSEKDFINELKQDDEDSSLNDMTLIEMQEANFNFKEKIKKIEIFLLSMCKFLEFYEKKVSEEIKHFRIVLMLETETNLTEENLSTNKSKINSMGKFKSFAISESKIKDFFLPDDALSFDLNAIKKFFKFFFDFENKFLYLVSIVSANVGLDIFSSNMDKNSLEVSEKNFSNCEDRQDFPKIIFIFNDNILNSLEGMKSLAITKLENKYKILHRTENEIFKQLKLEKKSKLLLERRKTSMNNIYSNFVNHINKDEKSSGKSVPVEFIESIESKLSSQMVKFTNDYVSMDIVLEKKNAKRKSILTNSQKNQNEISSKIDSKIINKDSFQSFQSGLASNLIKIDPGKDKEITNSSNLEDSYLTDVPRDDKDLKKTNPTKFRLKNRSEDFTKINDRKQDLQKLENKNYIDKNHHDKNIMKKSDFMEIFYNYKKKHIKNIKNDLVSSTSHFKYKVINKSKSKTHLNFRRSPTKLKISDTTGELRNKIDISQQPLILTQDNEQLIHTVREKSDMKNVSSVAFHSTRNSLTHNNRTSIDFRKSEKEITNLKVSFMNKNHNKLPSIRFETYTNKNKI